ncbi:MAG: hypothetical protein KAW12_24830 [Candidatus Aminicenantes bacterium]|nr:hypothetical protein [Candidatus Aminicenantes bacterium]
MEPKVLEIVIDGYGYDPELEIHILKSAFAGLAAELKEEFLDTIYTKISGQHPKITPETAFILFFNRNPLNIYFEKNHRLLKQLAGQNLEKIKKLLHSLKEKEANQDFIARAKQVIRDTAAEKKYAVWAAETPTIDRLRREYPSISTKTTGIEAGYEDLQPEVQGNSETGHQQLGNLNVAPQIPLEISTDIKTGKFFKNPVLVQAIKTAVEKKVNLNISFMVSGEFGDDGRVHSCWDHLENFLELALTKHKLDPGKLRIQAILDGRDCPLKSSLEKEGDKYGFLYKLKDLLTKYNADDGIAWIIGRGIAMDRDYEEERTKKDYLLLVNGEGHIANDFQGAAAIIQAFHKDEVFDPSIEPIVVRDKNRAIRKLENNDVFVDLNFRADRQRARIASLLRAKDFLQMQAAKKRKEWKFKWLKEDLKLDVYCITEYHPDLEKYGAKIVYPIRPHDHNFLSIFSRYFKRKRIPFKYLLTAESNKSVHMGYFIRGRRESLEADEVEKKFVIPSYGEEDDIFTDNDYYKTPHMKALAIAGKLLNELASGNYNLAIANISNPDMLGHLVNRHFAPCVRALEITDYAVKIIVEFALKEGYYIIMTSDHGNIDEYSSSHSLNDIITTFISPAGNIALNKESGERIRLFDIPWAIAEIFNISGEIENILPPIPAWTIEKGLVGETPIRFLSR